MITARLLGPVLLDVDGAPAPRALRWRKHLALCLLLWHAAERRLPRDRALALLWGDRPEREARHSLNEALRVIRRAVGDAALDTDHDWLTWRAPIMLDTDRFAELERSDAFAACELITGDWCEGFAVPGAPECDRWVDDERRWWRTRLVAALLRGTATAEGSGDLGRAMSLAARARRLDPLGEAPGRALMRVQFLTGDRAGAIETGRDLVRQLAENLGAVPEAETRAMLQAISTGGERGRPAVDVQVPRHGGPPLVGRAGEMHRLTTAMGACFVAPRSGMLIVDGESGSGRTRLLEELVARATVDGASVLVLRAVPADAASEGAGLRALAGIAQRRAPGLAAVPPMAVRTLVAAVPEWAENHVATPGDGVPLPTAVAAVLRTAAIERPLLVAIDDADFLDDESLLALPELLRATADLPVAMLVTVTTSARRKAIDRLVRHLDRDDRGTTVRCGTLGAAELEIAVAATMPQWDVEARQRLVRRIAADSAGLPGVAFPVLAAVAAGMDLDDAPWPAQDRTYDATLPGNLSDSLVAAIRLRYHQLPAEAARVLAAASLASGIASTDWLQRAVGLEAGRLAATLDDLEAGRWLVSDDRGYQFRARAVGALVAGELVTPGMRRRFLAAARGEAEP